MFLKCAMCIVRKAFFIFEQIKNDNEQSDKVTKEPILAMQRRTTLLENWIMHFICESSKPQGICYQAGVAS